MSSNLLYNYIRALQIEGRYPEHAGAWYATAMRLHFGWGFAGPDECPPIAVPEPGHPLPPPPIIDNSLLKRNRIGCYQRVRKGADFTRAIHFGATLAGVEIDAQWHSPVEGTIQLPVSDVIESHGVAIVDTDPLTHAIRFHNDWGEEWGEGGFAWMMEDYYDQMAIESYSYMYVGQFAAQSRLSRVGENEFIWDGKGFNSELLQVLEIYDPAADERMGWAILVYRNDGVDIEDLYVRPEFRRQGIGTQLVTMIRTMLGKKGRKPVRLWVPFVDCLAENPTNAPALKAIVKKLGLMFQPVGVRWAAYLATSEKGSEDPIEPVHVPARLRAEMPTVQPGMVATSEDALWSRFPKVGTEAWDRMNRRRASLIRKKLEGMLQWSAELQEYKVLQEQSLRAVNQLFPFSPVENT